jgi:hypothetical protein
LEPFFLSLSNYPFFINPLTFKTKKEETIMAKKKSLWIIFGILVISGWVLGSAIQAGAETMKFKVYTYVAKAEIALVGDVEGHALSLYVRRAFCVFENGEVATALSTITNDITQGGGTLLLYRFFTFADGSTIATKQQGTVRGTAVGIATSASVTGEIIKGTGRFEGIKGTETSSFKYFPVEKGEAGAKGIGETTFTYTLPSK